MSVHKGITSLEELSKAAGKGTTDLLGDHRFGPAPSLAWPAPHLVFKALRKIWAGDGRGAVGDQREFGEDPACGMGAPGTGSEGNKLTVGAGKREWGPGWFPRRSEFIPRPCLPFSHHSMSFHFLQTVKSGLVDRASLWLSQWVSKVPPFQASASPLVKRQDQSR